MIAAPTDGGLYQVIVLPDKRHLPAFRQDREAAFFEHARACKPVAEIIASGHRVGKLLGIHKYEGFFRESAGLGWALAGDAGHFKDPAPGQGISDAFRQVQALAPVIARTIAGSDEELDQAVKMWSRWRDRDAAEHYWLATDLGAASPTPAATVEILRRMQRCDQLGAIGELLQHRAMPSQVFTPARLLAAAAGLMAKPSADRRQVLREVVDMVVTDTRRRRLLTHPAFVSPAGHRDARATEMPQEFAA